MKIPIHMQAQTRAKAPFRVGAYSENILLLVTLDISKVIIAELIKVFQPFSFRKTRKHFPVYIFICFILDAPFISKLFSVIIGTVGDAAIRMMFPYNDLMRSMRNISRRSNSAGVISTMWNATV